jgi:pimeloyl-ACP methyl ester carboxylesterase
MSTFGTVRSLDGTRIAYERFGSGPAVVLVCGATDDGTENAPLGLELASQFTVYNYARRGRGNSGDIAPYAVRREIEDLAAVIDEAGGSTHVFGACSGGALALEAAAAGVAMNRLVVYDLPYDMGADAAVQHRRYIQRVQALLDEDRRAEAFELSMRIWGSPEKAVRLARRHAKWPHLISLAHTLPYDAACMGTTNQPPAARFSRIDVPTLVLTGSASQDHPTMSELRPNFFDEAADAVVACVPTAQRGIVAEAPHVINAEKLQGPIRDFLLDESPARTAM